jgi:flagellar hook-length control protein FliK
VIDPAAGLEVTVQEAVAPTGPASAGAAGVGAAGVGQPGAAASASGAEAAAVPLVEQVALAAGPLSAGRQVVIRLDPPDLGSVRMSLTEDAEGIRGVLRVAQAETAQELQREAAGLMSRLAAGGVQVRRLEIIVETPTGSMTQGYESAYRQGGDGQQNPSGQLDPGGSGAGGGGHDGGDGEQDQPAGEWVEAGPARPAESVGDDAINLWM